jgi:hypothetical protein
VDGHVATRPGPSVVETLSGRRRGFAIFPEGDLVWSADPLENPNITD